ncbi:MAG: hypothetical protein ABIO78_01915 [Thermoanaerobaculia bacterium]
MAYEHAFERFMAQYQVLDACWSVHEKMHGAKRPGQAARIGELAKFYNLKCPASWSSTKENDVIADIRNQIIHEATWGGATIGFAHPGGLNQSIHLELYWFNSRLILALLGEDSAYVHEKIVFQPYLIK